MNEKSAERPNTSLYEKIEESEEPPKPKEMIAKRRSVIKCVVVGDCRIGKSNLVATLQTLPPPEPRGDGCGCLITLVDDAYIDRMIQGEMYRIHIFDTIGDEGYDRLRPLSYPQTDVFLVCFSIRDPSSFTNVMEKWLPEVFHHHQLYDHSDIAFVLIGLHGDRRADEDGILAAKMGHIVGVEQGAQLARKLGEWREKEFAYLEVDARDNKEAGRILDAIVDAAYAKAERRNTNRRCKKDKNCTIL